MLFTFRHFSGFRAHVFPHFLDKRNYLLLTIHWFGKYYTIIRLSVGEEWWPPRFAARQISTIIIQQIVTMPIYGKEALNIRHPYMTDILRYT